METCINLVLYEIDWILDQAEAARLVLVLLYKGKIGIEFMHTKIMLSPNHNSAMHIAIKRLTRTLTYSTPHPKLKWKNKPKLNLPISQQCLSHSVASCSCIIQSVTISTSDIFPSNILKLRCLQIIHTVAEKQQHYLQLQGSPLTFLILFFTNFCQTSFSLIIYICFDNCSVPLDIYFATNVITVTWSASCVRRIPFTLHRLWMPFSVALWKNVPIRNGVAPKSSPSINSSITKKSVVSTIIWNAQSLTVPINLRKDTSWQHTWLKTIKDMWTALLMANLH